MGKFSNSQGHVTPEGTNPIQPKIEFDQDFMLAFVICKNEGDLKKIEAATHIMTDLYADDATLYEASKSKEQIERKLQSALCDLSVWCKQNGMLINTDKTKAMLITTPQKDVELITIYK